MFPEKANMMKHVQLCDFEEIDEGEEECIDQEIFSSPYCQNLFSNSGDIMKHKEEQKVFFFNCIYSIF